MIKYLKTTIINKIKLIDIQTYVWIGNVDFKIAIILHKIHKNLPRYWKHISKKIKKHKKLKWIRNFKTS